MTRRRLLSLVLALASAAAAQPDAAHWPRWRGPFNNGMARTAAPVEWRTAKVATPHEGYHCRYGSFASDSPVTDGQRVYAFFGSLGIYRYDLNEKLICKKDFPPMRMQLHYGEGAAAVVDGDVVAEERPYLRSQEALYCIARTEPRQ